MLLLLSLLWNLIPIIASIEELDRLRLVGSLLDPLNRLVLPLFNRGISKACILHSTHLPVVLIKLKLSLPE